MNETAGLKVNNWSIPYSGTLVERKPVFPSGVIVVMATTPGQASCSGAVDQSFISVCVCECGFNWLELMFLFVCLSFGVCFYFVCALGCCIVLMGFCLLRNKLSLGG